MLSCSQENLLHLYCIVHFLIPRLSLVEFPQDSDSEMKIFMQKVYGEFSLGSTPVSERTRSGKREENCEAAPWKCQHPTGRWDGPSELSHLVLSKGHWTWFIPSPWLQGIGITLWRCPTSEANFRKESLLWAVYSVVNKEIWVAHYRFGFACFWSSVYIAQALLL